MRPALARPTACWRKHSSSCGKGTILWSATSSLTRAKTQSRKPSVWKWSRRRTITYRGEHVSRKWIPRPSILKRRPAICVVDELAHTNVPGSERAKRWEDVQILLDAGIDVMTNMNIQHLESLNDQIFRITGVRVRETVPDWFVKSAAEVVMVDATTGALLNRLKRGDIYAPEKAQQGDGKFLQGIDSHGAAGTRPAPGRARTRIAGNRQRVRGAPNAATRAFQHFAFITKSNHRSDLDLCQRRCFNGHADQARAKNG